MQMTAKPATIGTMHANIIIRSTTISVGFKGYGFAAIEPETTETALKAF